MKHIKEEQLIQLARDAGQLILEIYQTDINVVNKEDNSPLTDADRASNTLIQQVLMDNYPDIPILSEEGIHTPYEVRKEWSYFWLVDPLDGTKEFIKKNGEFTVNIALIHNGFPVFGIVHIPVEGVTYVGTSEGAYMIDFQDKKQKISVSAPQDDRITIVESRSHPSPEMKSMLNKLEGIYKNVNRVEKGSSLKLCAIADGTAQLYPRLGPTMEWDTAAGQAVVEAAGGQVIDLQGQRFRYNKENLLNSYFLTVGDIDMHDLI